MATFDKGSAERLARAHPLLQKLMNEAIKKTPFVILDSQRGKAAQELAFRQKRTKAHFGNSAHNWAPSIALDVCPLPVNWKNTKPFVVLAQQVILPLANAMQIPIRWGGDWNMNGNIHDESFVDMPHYEMNPWRAWAKKSKLFQG